jgi:Domain of unknown function (DUF6431)
MHRIVAGITSLEQHEHAIEQTPETYRPPCCPHCGIKVVWRHGSYHRKADLCNRGEANRNPVPILRYCCSACRRTCSRLPECIAPRRWYSWLVQEMWLRIVLEPTATRPSSCPTPARRTLGRWHHWLQKRKGHFRFLLTSRFPDLGRAGDDARFWLGVFDTLGLSRAMAWCDQEISVP